MSNNFIRTDLASEARELWRESAGDTGELPGVKAESLMKQGFNVTTVEILDEEGAKILCKPIGKYKTIDLDRLIRREENAFEDCAKLLAEELMSLLSPLQEDALILVAGLGNEEITPDAIGPWTLNNLLVTRHLKEQKIEAFKSFRGVAALRSGVLGTTGIESAKLVELVTRELRPSAVIAVDALASRDMTRLCTTVQISDTGIVPGSGVGNARAALSRENLHVPVIAIGVPTVVDAATLAADMAAKAGVELNTEALPQENMIVTPRDIDRSARDAAKLVGYGINLALHHGITLEDVDMLLS